jgi:NitT/TauT family transport system substrate-binding protein
MAQLSGTTPEAFEGQLATTFLYADPKVAVAAMQSGDLLASMTRVRDFSFAQGLFGQGARSADAVGMEFPGGKTLGDKAAITLRFDPTYMQMAADGKL